MDHSMAKVNFVKDSKSRKVKCLKGINKYAISIVGKQKFSYIFLWIWGYYAKVVIPSPKKMKIGLKIDNYIKVNATILHACFVIARVHSNIYNGKSRHIYRKHNAISQPLILY